MRFGSIYIAVVLLIGSVYDWKYYSLPVWLLLVGILGGAGAAMYSLFWENTSVIRVGMAFLPGIISLLLSYISREQIGYGDGLMLIALGGCVGLQQTIMVVGIALAASFVVSVVLVMLRKAGRTQRLPFIPFLLMGYLILWGGGVLLA